jgi:type 1 glutamine amidotransferase
MFVLLSLAPIHASAAQDSKPKFRVVALAEHGGIHQPFVDAAKVWLEKLATDSNFSIDYIENTETIDAAFLSRYQLFIQLDYPPYSWTPTAMTAFVKYIEQGRGGWIGFHHATLLGEFDGYQMWPWFSQFMGDIRFTNYIPKFATATVIVEDTSHPALKNLGGTFAVKDEEWYTYNKSPRANVHVLARVDEDTYSPGTSTKMGDHPVVWTNEHYKARNIYIFMGHRPEHFQNSAFTTLFHNAILWAAHQ